MGNFEKLSVLVIVVIIVMILVVALYTWTDSPADATTATASPGPSADFASIIEPPKPPEKPVDLVVKPEPPPPPPPPPTPPPPPPEEKPAVREHVIASGDTLEKISKQYYGSMRHIADIERANTDLDPMRLRVGRKIVIPDVKGADGKTLSTEGLEKISSSGRGLSPGDTYTVRRGDSLPEIARRAYGKIDRWHEIWLANFDRIDDPDRLAAGTRLNLPR
jgi:nucleoid-associated protein YgaU